MYRVWLFSLMCIIPFSAFSYQLLERVKEEEKEENKKTVKVRAVTTTPLGCITQSPPSTSGQVVYMAAQEKGARDFAVAGILVERAQCAYAALQPAIFNNTLKSTNPFYDQPFLQLISTSIQSFAAVLAHEPRCVYACQVLNPCPVIFNTIPLDAHGQENGGIAHLSTAPFENNFFIEAAVNAHKSDRFGAPGSGIATYSVYKYIPPKKDDKPDKKQEKEPEAPLSGYVLQQIKNTVALDETSPLIALNNPAHIEKLTALHWDGDLKMLYAAFCAHAGNQETAGVRALVAGYYNVNNELCLISIAPETVFGIGTNQEIVGARGAGTSVEIHHLKTLVVEGLNYLIVHGGNGQESKRMVYALPLVNGGDTQQNIPADTRAIHGTLAKVNGQIQEGYSNKKVFLGRHFIEPAATQDDIYTTQSRAAWVGNGPLIAGDIAKIMVKDETVFALVRAHDGKPGILYYSQPILAENGVISAWTSWQPALWDTDLQDALDEGNYGNFLAFTGVDEQHITTIKRSEWGMGTVPDECAAYINEIFPPSTGGVHGLVEYTCEDAATLILTGKGTVMLLDEKRVLPGVEQAAIRMCPGAENSSVRVFQDTVLQSLGIITAADVTTFGDEHVVIVGGTHGVAVLVDQRGSGLRNGLVALSPDASFVRIGNYAAVQKIIADEQYVYIITEGAVDRIDLSASDLLHNTFTTVRLFQTSQQIPQLILDAIISEKFAVLATSTGLLRVGNDADIRVACTQDEAKWTSVTLPGTSYPPISLFAVSVTGRERDIARGPLGQLYVLSGYAGKNCSVVHRFAVHEVTTHTVSDATLQPLLDWRTQGQNGPALNLGEFRNHFVTDGTLSLHTGNRHLRKEADVINKRGRERYRIPLEASRADYVTAIKRSSATGAWMIAGNFGLRIQH